MCAKMTIEAVPLSRHGNSEKLGSTARRNSTLDHEPESTAKSSLRYNKIKSNGNVVYQDYSVNSKSKQQPASLFCRRRRCRKTNTTGMDKASRRYNFDAPINTIIDRIADRSAKTTTMIIAQMTHSRFHKQIPLLSFLIICVLTRDSLQQAVTLAESSNIHNTTKDVAHFGNDVLNNQASIDSNNQRDSDVILSQYGINATQQSNDNARKDCNRTATLIRSVASGVDQVKTLTDDKLSASPTQPVPFIQSKDLSLASSLEPLPDNMMTSASKKKKKIMKKKKKMEKKHKEWKKGKKHKKKKYESKKKKGGMEKKKKGKKMKKKWGEEKKGHKKKGNFKKKKWGSKKKMKKGHKKGKKGHKMLKDKGHKKKGFKKVYHKEEWGKKKKWHDIKREKKWNTKQKKWKKKWHQEKGKKYKGKHMKKYHKKNKHGKKYKKEKKEKYKKHKGEKYKKGHKKKKEEYSKKKSGGKKKKMKKMEKKMKKKKG